MIGKLYAVAIGNEAHSAVPNTLIEILADAVTPTFIERLYVGQNGFDTSENLEVTVGRIDTTGTGTATIPEPFSLGDVYQGVVETEATIEPTYTTAADLIIQAFNVLSGFLWTPANDDEVILVPALGLVGMKLSNEAPSTAMDFAYGCTLREIL